MAVDKGTGSGGSAGGAVVFSNPVYYHSKAFAREPSAEEIVRRNIQLKYPSRLCK